MVKVLKHSQFYVLSCFSGPNVILSVFPLHWFPVAAELCFPSQAPTGMGGRHEPQDWPFGVFILLNTHHRTRALIFQDEGLSSQQRPGRPHPRRAPRLPDLQLQSILQRAVGSCSEAYLRLDFLPVLLSDLLATPFIQLLKNATIYRQADVNL